MPRARNRTATEIIRISTTPRVCRELESLAQTGLFGKNPSEVAEQLLRDRVRELVLQGWPNSDRGRPLS